MTNHLTPRRLIRIKEVCHRVGVCRATIYNMIAAGDFPKQRHISAGIVAWPDDEVDAWITKRIAL